MKTVHLNGSAERFLLVGVVDGLLVVPLLLPFTAVVSLITRSVPFSDFICEPNNPFQTASENFMQKKGTIGEKNQ